MGRNHPISIRFSRFLRRSGAKIGRGGRNGSFSTHIGDLTASERAFLPLIRIITLLEVRPLHCQKSEHLVSLRTGLTVSKAKRSDF